MGDFEEKRLSFAIMLHAYLIQDKDEQLVKDRISDIEDRKVEIMNQRGKKKNELKETRTISETSKTI